MVASVYANSTDVPFEPTAVNTQSKCALACDAVLHQKVHAVESVGSYLTTLTRVLDDFVVNRARDGLFDVKVLGAIDQSASYVGEYREFINTVAKSEQTQSFVPHLTDFFEAVLAFKKKVNEQKPDPYLWRDPQRFIARELFVSTVAALLTNQRWNSLRAVLEHSYKVEQSGEFSYAEFDAFLRSIDLFRNRRLNLQRVSVAADILKTRVDESGHSFDDIMQADFVLHLFSLLKAHEHQNRNVWTARTLSFAQDACLSGFDLFITARGEQYSTFLKTVFDVADWTQLLENVRKIIGSHVELEGEDPDALDYCGFLALRNGIFNQ